MKGKMVEDQRMHICEGQKRSLTTLGHEKAIFSNLPFSSSRGRERVEGKSGD